MKTNLKWSRILFPFLFVALIVICVRARSTLFEKKEYALSRDPIDVVIPCTEKDIPTLDQCIEAIRKNGKNIRNIFVVSSKPLTDKAIWFDEKKFPFTKYDLAHEIFGNDEKATEFLSPPSRIGWIYQQLLKLYAPFVIPGISSNVLNLDADTIFFQPTEFLGSNGEGLYNTGKEFHPPYFEHLSALLPKIKKENRSYSGICHHMLFQKSVLKDLHETIQALHKAEPWQAICRCINLKHVHGASLSEYEIYFNFVFTKTRQMKIRRLKWRNISGLDKIPKYRVKRCHYVSCHAYSRSAKNI